MDGVSWFPVSALLWIGANERTSLNTLSPVRESGGEFRLVSSHFHDSLLLAKDPQQANNQVLAHNTVHYV